jgi:hypothetical protein
MRPDVVPGGIFPNYEPPDHTGAMRKLSELQGDDPLILMLARGHYCPTEHQQQQEAWSGTRDALQKFKAATGGWGFAQFKDGKSADEGLLKTCFPCHEPVKARDFVFTHYSP